MQFLANDFFAAQNARDMERVLGLFNFNHAVHFNFDDRHSGLAPVHFDDRERLISYLTARWVAGDTFSDVQVGPPDVAVAAYPDANPGGDFVRTVNGLPEKGTIKMVCADGSLVEIVMQSKPD